MHPLYHVEVEGDARGTSARYNSTVGANILCWRIWPIRLDSSGCSSPASVGSEKGSLTSTMLYLRAL